MITTLIRRVRALNILLNIKSYTLYWNLIVYSMLTGFDTTCFTTYLRVDSGHHTGDFNIYEVEIGLRLGPRELSESNKARYVSHPLFV